MDNPETRYDFWQYIARCSIKGTPIEELKEYMVVGYFTGSYLDFNRPPLLIGEQVMDEMMNLLSKQTIEEFDDFTGKYLTSPPEFRDLLKSPKPKPVILI